MAPGGPAATHAQIEARLNFMSEHTQLARGLLRGSDGRIRSKRLWESLCNSLNSMGSCTKSVEQWQRVWADRKHLAKKAAGAARRSASATGGGQSVAPTLSEAELKILSIMGEGFGEPQTDARVPAFPLSPPVTQDPGAISATQTSAGTSATPHSSEQPSMSIEAFEWELPRQNQQTSNSRPRVRRHFTNSARSRIIELEEQRLQVEIRRNELFGDIKDAIVEVHSSIRELSVLLREHIAHR